MIHMSQDATVKRLIESELREERELIKEYAYLKKLEELVEGRKETAALRVLSRVRRYERRLERAHRHVLYMLEEIEQERLPPEVVERIYNIERDLEFYIEDFERMTSSDDMQLRELIENRAWDELERYVIGNLEMDISRWLEIDGILLDLELDCVLNDLETT